MIADFPRHLNVGDQAIWLGERAALDELGVAVTGACDRATYRPAVLDRRLGDGALCIHGGGNFGDLYHTHHRLRLRLLHDFRGRRIVQLAQSIHFEDPAALEQTRRAIAAHGDVAIVVRDVHSQRLAATFDAEVLLAPDMAFALGSVRVPCAPERPVVRQAREDRERAIADRGADDVDWLVAPSRPAELLRWHGLRGLLVLATRATDGGRRLAPASGPPALSAYDAFARWSVRRGTRMLAGGAVVITDRLHGHILCVLMGIPHVVLPDRHGKIRNFWDTWTHSSSSAHWAAGIEEAREIAAGLVADAPGATGAAARERSAG